MAKSGDNLHIEISADAADAIKELANVISSLNDTKRAAKDLQGTLKNSGSVRIMDSQAGQDIKDQVGPALEGSLEQLRTQATDKAREAAKATVTEFGMGLSELGAAMDDVGKYIESGFGTMLKGIAATVGAISGVVSMITKEALDIGGNFEAQMTNVKVISGATAEELEELTRKAREMGEALPITARDAAEAMEILAQRGTSAQDILKSVTDISALSISQNVSMASAAELLGSAMTNFGISVDKAGQITDIFNNASNQSALTMRKLMEALKYVGPAASAAGMSLSETVAAMEVLANAGLNGSMIGTGLSVG